MDPPIAAHLSGALGSPGSSRVSLPLVTGATSGDGIFSGLASPPVSGPPTGSTAADGTAGRAVDQKREVFSDFRRFVSFGLRRDTPQPPT
jgi:hypothetical protein